MAEKPDGKIMFLSPRYPQLVIVMQADRQHIVGSQVINYPPKFLRFKRGPHGGFLETSAADEIACLRAFMAENQDHEVLEVKDPSQLKRVKPEVEVRQGAISTGARSPEAPKEEAVGASRAARTP